MSWSLMAAAGQFKAPPELRAGRGTEKARVMSLLKGILNQDVQLLKLSQRLDRGRLEGCQSWACTQPGACGRVCGAKAATFATRPGKKGGTVFPPELSVLGASFVAVKLYSLTKPWGRWPLRSDSWRERSGMRLTSGQRFAQCRGSKTPRVEPHPFPGHGLGVATLRSSAT